MANYMKEERFTHPETGELMVRLTGICCVTDKNYQVEVTAKAFTAWRCGQYIQDAFPELDADQREFLLSGITPAEWNRLYPEQE